MPKYDVFLSHNSTDKPAIEKIARRLTRAGFNPFLDKWHLIPGEPWQEAIEEALDDCATCAVFVGPSGIGPWQNEEMRAQISRRVSERGKSFRIIPVLLPGAERGERSRLPTFLVATTWVEFRQTIDDDDAFHRLVCGIRGQAPGPGPGEAIYEGQCPYRGLVYFDVEHAPFFFGREALTDWLLSDLRSGNRFLAIVGPSGSGKSSLARAGLLAALQQGHIPGSDEWPIVISRPTARPLERLAIDLSALTGADAAKAISLIESMQQNENALHVAAGLALHATPPAQRLIILEDQFEETFTLCRDDALRQAFVDNLLYAANAPQGRTIVLLTLRADFYGKCAEYPRLADALSDRSELVGPMTEDELRLAIQGPPQLVGAEFEPGLVEVLLRDVQGEPGNLPLLQHALLELWERRAGRKLTHAAYEEIGGVEGALERRAEDVYAGLDAQEQEICRRVFLRLTQPGEGTEDTKRRATLQELLPAEGERETVEEVVRALTGEEARLIITEGGEEEKGQRFVEVAHEALIRGWSRLRGWIEEDREWLRAHRRLTEAAREWERHGKDKSFLYRGGRLATAVEWARKRARDLNALERDFVQVSQRAARRQRRRTVGAFAMVLTVITVLAVVATTLSIQAGQRASELAVALQDANAARGTAIAGEGAAQNARGTAIAEEEIAFQNQEQAEYQARLARARQLANQAASYRNSDPQLALLLAMHAVSMTYSVDGYVTLEASAALRGLLVEGYEAVAIMGGEGHKWFVNSAAFSPDGTRVGTASWDATARVWDAETGAELAVLEGHAKWVNSAAFSPDGTRLVTASDDDTARVWDAETGAELVVLEGHVDDVNSAVFSPDGMRVVTASDDATARVWDAEMGEELVVLEGHADDVSSAAFSPDGVRVVTTSGDATGRVWDAETGVELAVLEGHAGPVTSAAFSPDGMRLVTASGDDTARVWDAEMGAELAVLEGHVDDVNSAAFGPDGMRVVTASWDATARVWDAETGAELAVLKGHTSGVRSAAFGPDGARVVTAGFDDTARVWDAETGAELAVLVGHTDDVNSAAFSPDGARVVTASDDETARVWDAETGVRLVSLGADSVNSVSLSPDGTCIVAAGGSGKAYVWDAETGAELAVLVGHTDDVNSTAFSPDGAWVVTASDDETARVWDAETGAELAVLVGHTRGVRRAAFSPDGARVVTVSDDDTARVWDAKTGVELVVLEGHTAVVNGMVFIPDGTRLVTTNGDHIARVWDAETGAELAVLEGHTAVVNSVAFSPDGARVVTASGDGTARVWDAETGEQLAVLGGHTSDLTSAAFSPDGTRIVTASGDDTARVWDAATGVELAVLEGHAGPVTSAAFSPDGTWVVTASRDETACIWDVETGEQLAVLEGHSRGVNSAAFSLDGTRVVTASDDGTARLWEHVGRGQISLIGHEKGPWRAIFDPSGQRVASAGQDADGAARIWDAESGAEVARLKGHGGGTPEEESEECFHCVSTIAFSPSGARVVTAGWDGTARVWDAASGEELIVLERHTGRLTDAAFDRTGTLVATSSGEDQTVRIWDAEDGDILSTLQTTGGTNYLDFSSDGSQLVAAGLDGRAWLWDMATGEERVTFEGYEEPLIYAVFGPDGDRVAAAGFGSTGFLWDVTTGARVATLEGHAGEIWQIAYSSRGDLIATAGADGTARLWDAQSGEERFALRGHEGIVWSVAFRPDGEQVATGGEDGTVRLWNTRTGQPEAVLPDTKGVGLLVNWEIDLEAGGGSPEEEIAWVYCVSYSPSGDRVVAASLNGSLDIYVADGGKLLEIAEAQATRELTCREQVQFLYEDLECEPEETPTPAP